MSTSLSFPELPIQQVIPEVLEKLSRSNTLIVHAPPGAGKSTLLPLAILKSKLLSGSKILMLEPRRLAAKTIAERMASLLGEEVGQRVGYRIRFDSKVSSSTEIEVLTEGILTRMLQHDNALEGVGLVIFDEFHERNIHADLAMALCRESQQILRPDLKILVMSATLDMPQLEKLLDCETVISEGKQYPVEEIYTGNTDVFTIVETVAETVVRAAREQTGDILAFLPGEGEIKKAIELLKRRIPEFSIHGLYGKLSPSAQHQAIRPHPAGKRKVVLATSIAETSLTIEGIRVVVDSGFTKKSVFNPRSGLSRLETVQLSKDSATQRKGRAGRLGPGVCYRLWSKANHQFLEDFRRPEIEEADLCNLVLELLGWGVQDIFSLSWLSQPPKGAVNQALETLYQINALENRSLTSHGKLLLKIPAHPRIAHMLVTAEGMNLLGLACDLAAVLEERDPLPQEKNVDINIRLEALRRARKEKLHQKGLAKLEKVANHYRKLFHSEADNSIIDPYQTGFLLANAFPERIASARPGNNAQFQLANGKLAQIHHQDDLAHEAWLAISHIDERDGMGKIFLASPLLPTDLKPLIKNRRVIKFDKEKGVLIAENQLGIGSIVLRSVPLTDLKAEEALHAIKNFIYQQGVHLFNLNKEAENLINRIESLRIWSPDLGLPTYSLKYLFEQDLSWLEPYLNTIKRTEDIYKLDITSILWHTLSFEQQQTIEALAPSQLQVPSGSKISIQYKSDGSNPLLEVRLQELFGMMESPKVCNSQVPLTIHLLSPGFKLVQITSDLKSFWNDTYFEVKKELKRRYPKHSWPDNPLEAEAIKGVKRKPNM
ncbi:ATP-dependent helicase HrpB [Mongoliitalea daihaiensis]|uniref:ATP-dependent helicase HrpB n=1 Tax=Mongoliitalea daihaiensis TaxID=2782006 RepID=UPI001F206F8E|nr:ATP-dependent helicase HrpB [Mongoliitalea daihaiensis]UJP64096.1 ATP-dependent helicase HrpB [Mongoliitalea daihaiensis]